MGWTPAVLVNTTQAKSSKVGHSQYDRMSAGFPDRYLSSIIDSNEPFLL